MTAEANVFEPHVKLRSIVNNRNETRISGWLLFACVFVKSASRSRYRIIRCDCLKNENGSSFGIFRVQWFREVLERFYALFMRCLRTCNNVGYLLSLWKKKETFGIEFIVFDGSFTVLLFRINYIRLIWKLIAFRHLWSELLYFLVKCKRKFDSLYERF